MPMLKQASDLGSKNIPKQLLMQVTPAPLQVLYFREESTSPANVTVELWKLEDGDFAIFQGSNGEGAWGTENISLFDKRPTLDSALATIRQNFVVPNIPDNKQSVATQSRLKKVVAASTAEELELANQLEEFRSQLSSLVEMGRAIKSGLSTTIGPSAAGRFESYIVNRLDSMASDREQFTFADVIDELQNMED